MICQQICQGLTSALGEHRSNKTYQSRLTRWVDRLLPYQFKVIHIPGRDMGIVDYLSREPNGEQWPESELDERFVVTSIEIFHKALDCLSSRCSETDQKIDVNILKCQTKKDWKKISNQSAITRRMDKNQSGSGKSKKITNRQNEERRDELTEQVTETTFSRTRMVKRGACSRQDSDTSDSDLPQVEWRTVKRSIKPKGRKEITPANSAETNLISFWDLTGAEKSENPKSLLELEARTVLEDRNRREQNLETNVQREKPPLLEV